MGSNWSNTGGKNHDVITKHKSQETIDPDQLAEVEISILKKLDALEERLSTLVSEVNKNAKKE
jgi:hypothetical protein